MFAGVDLSIAQSSDIHLRAVSEEIHQPKFTKMNLKFTFLKFIEIPRGQ